MRLPLPVRSYRGATTERLVNCYAEVRPADGEGPVRLIRAPGIRTIQKFTSSGRGMHVFAGELWAIVGDELGKVIDFGGGTYYWTSMVGLGGTSRCPMVEMVGKLVVLAADIETLYYTDGAVGGSISTVTDVDLRPPLDMDFSDNFLVLVEADSGRWFRSDVNDATAYGALNWATAESQPDQLVGLIADHGQVFLAGERSCEIWQLVGGEGFGYQRVPSGTLELGCIAGASLAKADNSVFWLASDLTVRRLDGFTPLRVSQHGVEEAILGYGEVSDAYAFSYTLRGHIQYVLTFPDRGTWVFDVTTGEWHERATKGKAHWAIVDAVQLGNDVYVQHEDGSIGILDHLTYSEFGEDQVVVWTNQKIAAAGARLFVHRAELMVNAGEP